MRIEEQPVLEFSLSCIKSYLKESHSVNLEKEEWDEWSNSLDEQYKKLRKEYKSCFEEKNPRLAIKLDEHKVLSCLCIAIQCVKYPYKLETNIFKKEKLILYLIEKGLLLISSELKSDSIYEIIFNKKKIKYPEVRNESGDDYQRQLIKQLHYSYKHKNKDIFNLSNVIFLLEDFNYSYYKYYN